MRRNAANWLHRHADGQHDRRLLRFVQNVNPATINGRTWSTATDTKSILAVDDGGQLVHESLPLVGEGFRRFQPELERYLALAADSWRESTLPDVWDWLAFSRRAVCEECRTLLAHELDHDCNTCDQGGFVVADEMRLGQIGSAVVDVEQLLQSLPPELLAFGGADGSQLCRIGSALASPGRASHDRMVLVRGERWRVAMMGQYLYGEDDENERRWATSPRYLPGVGPLWHARHHPVGRLVLADWYEENGEPEYAAHLRENVPPW